MPKEKQSSFLGGEVINNLIMLNQYTSWLFFLVAAPLFLIEKVILVFVLFPFFRNSYCWYIFSLPFFKEPFYLFLKFKVFSIFTFYFLKAPLYLFLFVFLLVWSSLVKLFFSLFFFPYFFPEYFVFSSVFLILMYVVLLCIIITFLIPLACLKYQDAIFLICFMGILF